MLRIVDRGEVRDVQDEAWKRVTGPAARAVNQALDAGVLPAFSQLLAAREDDARCVVAQLGLSLDGRIATTSGDSCYINGADALSHLHRIRALVDAVVVGAGTVRADDPRLTVRHCDGADPARVVIDPNGTVPAEAQVWADTGCRRIVFGGAPDLPCGVERVTLPQSDIPPAEILDALDTLGFRRVLIEGGADTLSRFMTAGAVDCLHLLYGRVIIGSGKAGLNLPEISALSDARRPETSTHLFPDGDFLVSCDLRAA